MATISKDQIQIATVASNSIKLDQIGDLAKTTEGQGELAKDLAADNSDATLGSKTPLVVINGYYVTKYLQYFNLDMNGFMPVIRLSFTAMETSFLSVSYPKDGDIVSVYIRSLEDVYKPIRMDFNILTVDAELTSKLADKGIDWDGLGRNLKFNILAECRVPGIYTNRSKSFRASTSYDALFQVAQDLDLGFSTNDSNLNDTMNWICPNYSYFDFVKDVTGDSYKDDNSFYMSFIDCYYNLNFVNMGSQFLYSGDPEVVAMVSVSPSSITPDTVLPSAANPEPKQTPLIISNSWKAGSVPFALSGFILVSGAGQKSNKTGYFTRITYYDENNQTSNLEDKIVGYDIESGTPDSIGANTVLQKGRATEDLYKNERRIEWLGVVNEYSEDNPGTHPNYFHARYQNLMNIEDATKLLFKVEMVTYFAGIYRGQVLPVQMYVYASQDKRKANTGTVENYKSDSQDQPVLDNFLSGNYVVVGMDVTYDSARGMRQVLTLAKRQWAINTSGILQKYSPFPLVDV
jgi:hypothetical protein